MKKKLQSPVAKAENKSTEKKTTDGNTSRRKFSLKHVIIILAAFLIVSVSVVVPVCIYCVDIPIKPAFSEFDQKNDYSITVTWKKVAGAERYDVEFCHDDPSLPSTTITKGATQNGRYTIQRQAGTLYFRVRAIKNGKKGKFSDWIQYDIEAWKLSAPVITVDSSNLIVSWIPVTYRYYNDNGNKVTAYTYSYAWEIDGEDLVWYNDKSIASEVRLDSGLFTHRHFLDYYQGYSDEWPGDVTLHIKVSALNHGLNMLGGFSKKVGDSVQEQALYTIYEENGEYGEATLDITKEIFDALAK